MTGDTTRFLSSKSSWLRRVENQDRQTLSRQEMVVAWTRKVQMGCESHWSLDTLGRWDQWGWIFSMRTRKGPSGGLGVSSRRAFH